MNEVETSIQTGKRTGISGEKNETLLYEMRGYVEYKMWSPRALPLLWDRSKSNSHGPSLSTLKTWFIQPELLKLFCWRRERDDR